MNKPMSLIKKVDMTTIDTRTPHEKARDEKHKRICDDFLRLSNETPGCKPYRAFRALGEKYDMTSMGIRDVLVKHGLFSTPKK